MSKTPEESTNSAEAVALAFESACTNRCDGDVYVCDGMPEVKISDAFVFCLLFV
jgi:hypothetical protein